MSSARCLSTAAWNIEGNAGIRFLDAVVNVFPDIALLEGDDHFVETASTVNLQVWFQRKGLLANARRPHGDYRNVIAGLEPLCVAVD